MPNRPLPKEVQAEIIRLYCREGLSRAEVARRTFVDDSVVTDVVRRNGEYVRPRGPGKVLDHAEYERTVRLYRSGMLAEEIARVLGVSRTTVYDRLRRAGEPRRSRSEVAGIASRARWAKVRGGRHEDGAAGGR